MKVAILTASDRCARGEQRDESGQLLYAMMAGRGAQIVAYQVLPDDMERIAATLGAIDHNQVGVPVGGPCRRST